MACLKPHDEEALFNLLNNLYIFIDRCQRSQLAFEDFDKNRGILTKTIEFLKGRSSRISHLSAYCNECANILAGGGNNIGITLMCEVIDSLKEYKEDVKKIQEACTYEECEEALKLAKDVKEKVLNKYLNN
ncbi:MAG: hypothetical protein QW403_03165, partial [Candidatus Aenigmatarchaeota archaeon]